jgi:hypothetical protein
MKLSEKSCVDRIEETILPDEELVVNVSLLLQGFWYRNLRVLSRSRCNPLSLVLYYGTPSLVEQHIRGELLDLPGVAVPVCEAAKRSLRNLRWIERANITVVELYPGWPDRSIRTLAFADVGVIVTVFTSPSVDENTD